MSSWYKDKLGENRIIISSRIRLARNLKNLPFPARMSEENFTELKNKVKNAISDISKEGNVALKFIDMNDVPLNEIEAMVERHVISPAFAKNCLNRAIAISDDESISLMIGEEDHIRIQVTLSGQQLNEAYSIADMLDTKLNERLGFAFDSRLGFLTECPTNIGTGLRASLMLHLPVCESKGEIASITDAAGKIGLTVRGMYGEGSKASASLYQLSNQITLGISEKNAIDNLTVIAEQIVNKEEQNRTLLDKTELEDTVYRSLGILKFARLMSSEEFMKHISMIKLGVDTGIIEDNGINPVSLLIEAQPNMLQKKYYTMNPAERDAVRAKMIRDIL